MRTKSHKPNSKLKPPPRQLFSCAFFRHCAQTIHSPTTPRSPTPPPPPQNTQIHHLPPPPPPQQPQQPTALPQDSSTSSTTTSSSSTSQSFTQWRFTTPTQAPTSSSTTTTTTTTTSGVQMEELFSVIAMQLESGSASCSDANVLAALHSLESSLVPNPKPIYPSSQLISGVVKMLSHSPPAAKSATKILLALCLAEQNRRVAVEVGAVGAVIESVSEMERATSERALAALELMCTVAEGAAELRSHALAVPMMVEMMGRLEGHRGKEYAISVLAVVYGEIELDCVGTTAAPAEEVARAVALALQGECSARGRRKGALLLKILNDKAQPLDVTDG